MDDATDKKLNGRNDWKPPVGFRNAWAGGSNPSCGTIKIKHIAGITAYAYRYECTDLGDAAYAHLFGCTAAGCSHGAHQPNRPA